MDPMLEAGAGQVEITPPVGTPLSGFIARENRPSTRIDTPLFVKALALRASGHTYFLISYELLGLDTNLEERILVALEQGLGSIFNRQHCALTTVHTHSGPCTGLLLGEADPAPEYLDHLENQTLTAVAQALASLQPAYLLATGRRLPGLTYNRRALLSDGRISIAPVPDLPVIRRGSVDDRLTILLFRGQDGRNLAAMLHYACHGVGALSQAISADIPGMLAEAVSAQLEAPCLFLPGAAGDVNPTTVTASHAELRIWMAAALSHLGDLEQSLQPVPTDPIKVFSSQLGLEFAPLPSYETVEKQVKDLARIIAGDTSSPVVQATLLSFKNTMNLAPDAPLDPGKSGFVAQVLSEHAQRVLAAIQSRQPLPPLLMRISVWRLGPFVLVFLAGEIFSSTGLKLRGLSDSLAILPVSCLAPLVGYLPDQEAYSLGGYEVNDAWRFYGQPSPFVPDSEPLLVEALANLIRELSE